MPELIFKIAPSAEWACVKERYEGSAHDRTDGFLHFSTWEQLPETLRCHYADQNDLLLIAVEAAKLERELKWEHSPARREDFPHLYAALPLSAVRWARPIAKDAHGDFVLPG